MESTRGRRDAVGIHIFNNNRERLISLLVQEESYWRQRSKAHWLKEGDLSTHFFHVSAIARKKVNKVERLEDRHGNIVAHHGDLCQVAHDYFQELFTENVGAYQPILHLVNRRVENYDNIMLLRSFTLEEFTHAIQQMEPNKAPGPDGFNPGFYQNIWDTHGQDKRFLKHVVGGWRGGISQLRWVTRTLLSFRRLMARLR